MNHMQYEIKKMEIQHAFSDIFYNPSLDQYIGHNK